ncbi:MAG: hypothetical protein HUJ30_05620 [Gammaproteobacteria bacterium]|nr:hypothetical protein [Gammaproteobacteria bacterium]
MTTKNTDNWHYASETAEMLRQAIAHIQLSMHDGSDSIESLTSSFNSMNMHLDQINDIAEGLSDAGQKEMIQADLDYCKTHINSAVVSMQFYDTLTQRLEFAAILLHEMSNLIRSPGLRDSEEAWKTLQTNILEKCHVRQDLEFIQAIREGKNFDQARSSSSAADDGGIDLF